jgi:23S rRNA (adenine2503-C2)-methyltransferase
MVRKCLCGLSAEEVFDFIKPSGFTYENAVSVSNSIYKRRVSDLSMIEGISKKLKAELINKSSSGIYRAVSSEISTDKSVKYLFRKENGQEFETVYLPEEKRNTVCVSTQSGCRMGCSFCATGRYGFRGNLTAGDIINQIISIPDANKVTHVVFMGMGEPMDNLEDILKACRIMTSEWGLAISPRNVTVSTVGIMPETEQFLKRSECNLTLSLCSPFPFERKLFIPSEIKHPARDIIEVMKNFPLKKKRRLSIAYVMIKDFNDSDRHLEELIILLNNSSIRVNLLPYHSIAGDSISSSSTDRMHYFKHNLVIAGISASIRKSRGSDISAACGLLASGLK